MERKDEEDKEQEKREKDGKEKLKREGSKERVDIKGAGKVNEKTRGGEKVQRRG